MKLSIGILAHNEEHHIISTLKTVQRQSLFSMTTPPSVSRELIVVVNGTSDRTAELAREFVLKNPFAGTNVRIEEIEQGGKAHAWNHYVHEMSAPDTTLFVFLDADILLPEQNTLEVLVRALEEDPRAVVAVDLPMKNWTHQDSGQNWRSLSNAASALAASGPPKLCGQLYAARATALRAFWIPEGMLVEDGYIRAMLLTNNFREREELQRIVRPAGAMHLFDPEVGIRSLLRHEKRILIGTLVNIALFQDMQKMAERGENPGTVMGKRNAEDPEWFTVFANKNWRTVWKTGTREYVSLPLRQWKALSSSKKPKAFPCVLARTAINFLAMLAAKHDLARELMKW